ncbi:MAG: 5-methyltetrahydrofolate--homocysteine methyltransferase [bacterium]|jgi:5-methyltetrahydrofolate--homocysteine methyltransferase
MNPQEFRNFIQEQVLIIDGAMGTMIQNLNLDEKAYGGGEFQMLSDLLVFSRPNEVKGIHQEYFEAGANAVETNTFGASPLRLQEFDFSKLDLSDFPKEQSDIATLPLNEFCYRMNKQAAEVANQAKEEYQKSSSYDGRELFVFGSIGPSNWVLSSTKADLNKGTYEQIEDNFYQQVLGLIDGKADVLLFETQQDILELKVAVLGAKRAMKEKGTELPIISQVTVDQFSKMQIFNTDIHAALTTVQNIGIDVFGINCSIGPDLMIPTVEKLSKYATIPISVIPNAGLPVSEAGQTIFKQTPEDLANHLKNFVDNFGVNIVGGCCGTTPAHIKAISDTLKGSKPKQREYDQGVYVSGPQNAILLDGSDSLIRIGERLNVRGSKKVRDAVENEGSIDQEVLEEVINEQVRDLGIDVIDVCMDSNTVDTTQTLVDVIKSQTVDFSGAMCLDSFDVEALEEAIKVYPGRPIINSISLEEYQPGVDKIDAVVKPTYQHQPIYIALTTGPKGPAVTEDEKYTLAKEIYEKVTSSYPVEAKQLLFDVNAFPIGAESIEGMNFAMESIRSIPRVKSIHPDIRTTIGVGNLTNGLAKKPYMRKVLTSVFLDEARKVGLDAAIINPNHYVPVESLPKADYEIALKIIRDRDMDAFEQLEEIAEAKKGNIVKKRSNYDDLETVAAVCEKIKDGYKQREKGEIEIEGMTFIYIDTIVLQIAELIKDIEPLVLINDHLMNAMEELGSGFAEGTVSLPHLLKSADVMKQVMGFLEDYMKRKSGESLEGGINYKGTIVLGTVYQDVHSIGKDLTKTLLENYGYRVIDLGVQVPLEKFVETAKEYQADAIGMSALLVQTSNHMITVSEMMKEAGLEDIDILIGGAPVNNRHAAYVAMAGEKSIENIRDNVFYCGSAMDGVNIMSVVVDKKQKTTTLEKNKKKLIKNYERAVNIASVQKGLFATLPRRTSEFTASHPQIQQWNDAEKVYIDLMDFLPEINRKNLFVLNWKYGGKSTWEKKGVSKEILEEKLQKFAKKAQENGWLEPQGICGLFPCKAINESEVAIFDPSNLEKEVARFSFNDVIGQGKKDQFSIAGYFKTDEFDLIGVQISTAGSKVDQFIEEIKVDNQEEALILQGLSDRIAEDMAEYLNKKLSEKVYQNLTERPNQRYSPGYPAMSEIKNNLTISNLLGAVEILKIRLTDAHEFHPTGTTAAVVCFHKDAGYH